MPQRFLKESLITSVDFTQAYHLYRTIKPVHAGGVDEIDPQVSIFYIKENINTTHCER